MPDRPDFSFFRKLLPAGSKSLKPGSFRHFKRGRYALGEAYRLAGVSREGALLAPAYHCVTMLDPAVALGADILLYPLQPDLSPVLAKLDELLATYGKPVKALLATHYFGLAKDFSDVRQWCDNHDIALIEDCSHALFTETFQAAGTGVHGRFVASSPYKFFACADGGLLYSPDPQRLNAINTESASLLDELRGIKRTIEKCRSTNRFASEIGQIDERLVEMAATPIIAGNEQISTYSRPSSLYSTAESKIASLLGSRSVVSLSSVADNMTRRRHNFQRWVEAVSGLPCCHALFPDLPEGSIPYMFPLHITHPEPHFYWLKNLGMPVWRWDDMAVSGCSVAQDYRRHLLHLPCHQALTKIQLNWMLAAVRKTLRLPMQGTK